MNIVYLRQRSRLSPTLLILTIACAGQLMVVIDGLIVTVALPDIRSAMGLSPTTQAWVVNGYLLSFGALLLAASHAADRLGHRRVFVAGVAVFTLASLGAGLAPGAGALLVARIVQGMGAAAIAPTSLSLLTTSFDGSERARALSIWSAVSAAAGAGGLVLGGVITAQLGWRWVFLVNVPVGIALLLLASSSRASGHDSARREMATFEWRAMLRRTVIVANTSMSALGAAMTATVYCLSLYLQNVEACGPLDTGLALLPMSVVLAVGALRSPRLLVRLGMRVVATAGTITMVTGLVAVAVAVSADLGVAAVVVASLLWACGAGVLTMPIVSLATSGVPPTAAGLASGLVSTTRQLGGVVGVAAVVALAASLGADFLH